MPTRKGGLSLTALAVPAALALSTFGVHRAVALGKKATHKVVSTASMVTGLKAKPAKTGGAKKHRKPSKK